MYLWMFSETLQRSQIQSVWFVRLLPAVAIVQRVESRRDIYIACESIGLNEE